MSKRLKEDPQSHQEHILIVDPAELLAQNPVALIVNQESYRRMEASFSPDLLDPPWVAYVQTSHPKRKRDMWLGLIDGATRTKFMADHKGQKVPGYPKFSFDRLPVRDVTRPHLENSVIAPEPNAIEQTALSIQQYLRAVIPPTKIHENVAPMRIAAHLVKSWEGRVGPEITEHFSAIAAFHLLSDPGVPQDPKELEDYLKTHPRFVTGESREARKTVIDALVETQQTVQECDLMLSVVAREAFTFVGKGEVIGSEQEARQQVFGLLHVQAVEEKLKGAAGKNIAQREQLREQLGEALASGYKRYADQARTIAMLNEVVTDPRTSTEATLKILRSRRPLDDYSTTITDRNRGIVERRVLEHRADPVLSDLEKILIHNATQQVSLLGSSPEAVADIVVNAAQAIGQADAVIAQLVAAREAAAPTREGQTAVPTIFDESLTAVLEARTQVVKSIEPDRVQKRAIELERIVREEQNSVSERLTIQHVSHLVSDVFADEIAAKPQTKLREHLTLYVTQGGVEDPSNLATVHARLLQLKGFEESLRQAVTTGRMSFSRAFEYQAERRSLNHAQPPPFLEAVTVKPSRTETLEAAERRRSLNNADFIDATGQYAQAFVQLDLDTSELSPDAKNSGEMTFNKLGGLLFEHPDASRVVTDYKAEIAKRLAEAQRKAQQEQEELLRSTKTGV